MVIDKGAGLVVHPARGHRDGTLSQLLADQLAGGDPERAGIVHRLDRDTSGLLVVSRSEEAHRLLASALARREIRREYLALVEGRPPARAGTIEAPIGRDPRIRTRMAVGGGHAREARTHFTLEREYADASLLRLRLETRSVFTCRRSVIPYAAIRNTAARVCWASSASSCTLRGSPLSTHSQAGRSTSSRPFRAISVRRSLGYPRLSVLNFDPRASGSRPCPMGDQQVAAIGSASPARNTNSTYKGSNPWPKLG
jgi:hypothetical protein